jgi:hypothetical protein
MRANSGGYRWNEQQKTHHNGEDSESEPCLGIKVLHSYLPMATRGRWRNLRLVTRARRCPLSHESPRNAPRNPTPQASTNPMPNRPAIESLVGAAILMRIAGTRAIHFGRIGKKDFLIPPFALLFLHSVCRCRLPSSIVARTNADFRRHDFWLGQNREQVLLAKRDKDSSTTVDAEAPLCLRLRFVNKSSKEGDVSRIACRHDPSYYVNIVV